MCRCSQVDRSPSGTQLREGGWDREGICIVSRSTAPDLAWWHQPQAVPWRQLKCTQERGAGVGDRRRLKPLLEKLQWGQGQVQGLHQAEKWEGSLDINQDHIKVCEVGRIQWTGFNPENKSPGTWAGCTQWPCTLRGSAGCCLHE